LINKKIRTENKCLNTNLQVKTALKLRNHSTLDQPGSWISNKRKKSA